ncbi:MAG: sigma-70 family RNA polymerase sigma factor [Phycisphaerae bacterium]
MADVTHILTAIEHGDARAADELLPIVYQELRRLAAGLLRREQPGQTLQATALVHEAYLRLVGSGDPGWEGRRHFFASAAEAMRRILVENARRKKSLKRGGKRRREELEGLAIAAPGPAVDLLALDEALRELQHHDPQAAELVKLRYFAGLRHQEAAEVLGIGRRAADRLWAVARAWLHQKLSR